MKSLYYNKVQVSVFLDQKVTPAQRSALETELKAEPEIKSFRYETQAEAYARFRELFKQNPDSSTARPRATSRRRTTSSSRTRSATSWSPGSSATSPVSSR